MADRQVLRPDVANALGEHLKSNGLLFGLVVYVDDAGELAWASYGAEPGLPLNDIQSAFDTFMEEARADESAET